MTQIFALWVLCPVLSLMSAKKKASHFRGDRLHNRIHAAVDGDELQHLDEIAGPAFLHVNYWRAFVFTVFWLRRFRFTLSGLLVVLQSLLRIPQKWCPSIGQFDVLTEEKIFERRMWMRVWYAPAPGEARRSKLFGTRRAISDVESYSTCSLWRHFDFVIFLHIWCNAATSSVAHIKSQRRVRTLLHTRAVFSSRESLSQRTFGPNKIANLYERLTAVANYHHSNSKKHERRLERNAH